MGNCCKKKSFLDEYLFEPLSNNDENNFDEFDGINNSRLDFRENSCEYLKKDEYDGRIISLEEEIIRLNNKLVVLESNTTQNLKLISEDIHYINSKQNTYSDTTPQHSNKAELNITDETDIVDNLNDNLNDN